MKTVLSILLFAAAATGCTKNVVEQQPLDSGSYQGTFERKNGSQENVVSAVTITLNGNGFSGTSQYPKYPAICNGSYSVDNGKITFVNGCAWTADFDWTLVLNNQYDYTVKGDSLIISRQYGTGVMDVYKLEK